eukprot:1449128-Prymnesium_polylepis.1
MLWTDAASERPNAVLAALGSPVVVAGSKSVATSGTSRVILESIRSTKRTKLEVSSCQLRTASRSRTPKREGTATGRVNRGKGV